MSIKAIECPDGVCHSHHGGHAVPRQAMQKNLEKHGNAYCEITEAEDDVEIKHPVKPVWCDGCNAYHVECEYGCCVIEK